MYKEDKHFNRFIIVLVSFIFFFILLMALIASLSQKKDLSGKVKKIAVLNMDIVLWQRYMLRKLNS
jgi:hypothetical protein